MALITGRAWCLVRKVLKNPAQVDGESFKVARMMSRDHLMMVKRDIPRISSRAAGRGRTLEASSWKTRPARPFALPSPTRRHSQGRDREVPEDGATGRGTLPESAGRPRFVFIMQFPALASV